MKWSVGKLVYAQEFKPFPQRGFGRVCMSEKLTFNPFKLPACEQIQIVLYHEEGALSMTLLHCREVISLSRFLVPSRGWHHKLSTEQRGCRVKHRWFNLYINLKLLCNACRATGHTGYSFVHSLSFLRTWIDTNPWIRRSIATIFFLGPLPDLLVLQGMNQPCFTRHERSSFRLSKAPTVSANWLKIWTMQREEVLSPAYGNENADPSSSSLRASLASLHSMQNAPASSSGKPSLQIQLPVLTQLMVRFQATDFAAIPKAASSNTMVSLPRPDAGDSVKIPRA